MGLNYSKVYLDSCIVIYLLEGKSSLQSLAQKCLYRFLEDGTEIWLSDLSRLECRVKPLREGQLQLLSEYERFFKLPEVHIATLGTAVLERATHIRAQTGLKTPDAIHAATALIMECECFMTNDFKFKQIEPSLVVELLSDT